ncbi:MAG: GxxExxY protein [Chitinophagaceae bacterium]|nr:MAG: GxxExxY protein [Chitinophagaceae bacterium]
MTENEIASRIVNAAYNVHSELGPGLLESTYEACLSYELSQMDLAFEVQKALPVIYHNVKLECGYRMDILVNNKVVIEIKSVEALNDVHMAQILTYLKLSGCKLGFLINFNVKLIKHGIKRVINGKLD